MEATIYPGLEGVHIGTSKICKIDGLKGDLIYCGYHINELANKASFEEVSYLLWNGDLPNAEQLRAFQEELQQNYELPQAVYDLLAMLPTSVDPMHAIQSAVAALAAFDPNADDVSLENVRRIGMQLLARFPVVVANFERIRQGKQPLEPNPKLSIAENFLYILNGEVPSEAASKVMDTALVLHAEHGSNASTFTARATSSTLTDVYSAIAAAVGSLKGPLHGGANEAVMRALESIGSNDAVEDYIMGKLADPKGRVPGFGHRVYRVLDPRATILRKVAEELAVESPESKWFEMSLGMAEVMEREMDKRGKEVRPNVDFFSASVYRMLGFPTDMYTPIFAVARISGWMAHLLEQYADNRLMRPRLVYEGQIGRTFTPIESR